MMPEQTAASILLAALAEISRRVDTLHDGMGEIQAKLVGLSLTGQQTLDQATRTNGRLTKLESRMDEHDDWHVVQDAVTRGRKEQREDDFETLSRVRNVLAEYVPLALAAALGVASTLLFVLDWDFWPW